ncbi:intimin C-type lectin domain-containing protein, partial [Escherichia coli]|uniref:intimin C-type lectin domain-containing protein n=1 Tax=Escherichia coli TaxID=562 RepID=UPI003D7A15B5
MYYHPHRTVSYTIKAPNYMIRVGNKASYANAMSFCGNLLPSSQTVLSNVYNSWGPANGYDHY